MKDREEEFYRDRFYTLFLNVKELFGDPVDEVDDFKVIKLQDSISIMHSEDEVFTISYVDFVSLMKEYLQLDDYFVLSNEHYHEESIVIMDNQAVDYRLPSDTNQQIIINNTDLGIITKIGRPSTEFIIFLLLDADNYYFYLIEDSLRKNYDDREFFLDDINPSNSSDLDDRNSFINAIRKNIPFNTIKLFFNHPMTSKELNSYIKNIFFLMATQNNILIKQDLYQRKPYYIYDDEELSSFNLIIKDNTNYNETLIDYYLQAQKANFPNLQFLFYYHIIEYYIDSISDEYIVDETRKLGKDIDFSSSANNQILKFIKELKNIINYKNEHFELDNTEKSISLVLERFVPLEGLIELLSSEEKYDRYYESYSGQEIEYLKLKALNIHMSNKKLYDHIAKRIYSIRNSIVHQKSKKSNNFSLEDHEEILSNELIIMKIIAEYIIVK